MSQLVIGEDGLHLLVAQVQWYLNSTGGRTLTLSVKRAGVVVREAVVVAPPAENGWSVQQAVLQHIAEVGDEIEVSVRQSSGASLSVEADRTYLQIARIAQ